MINYKNLPYGKQNVDKKDIKSVIQTLYSEKLTTGKFVDVFEKNFSKYTNCKYSLSCNSGTSAILLSLLSIDLKKGDNVIIPSVNFIAAANMCKFIGANIFFADVDKHSFQVTSKTIEECIKNNGLKKIKVFFSMYLGGAAENIEDLAQIKKKYNCYFIEDACHALGSIYSMNRKKIKVGSCKFSDISIFSFHPVKTITTGEGGMINTNSKKIFSKVKNLRSHDIVKRKNISYEIKNYGFNFRLSDINCSLGISQLKKLDIFVKKRREIANYYFKGLRPLSKFVKVVNLKSLKKSSWHLLILYFENYSRKKLIKLHEQLKLHGIFTQQHYIPSYKFVGHKNHKKNDKLINSEKYYNSCLSFPIFYDMKKKDVVRICKNLKKSLNV